MLYVWDLYQTPMANAACTGNVMWRWSMCQTVSASVHPAAYLSIVSALAEAILRNLPIFLGRRGEEEDKEEPGEECLWKGKWELGG